MALIGYARVSTDDQTAEQQITALQQAGCVRVLRETASGASRARPELARALDAVRRGDVFVVMRIDRLARSLSHLLDIVEGLDRRGVGFRSLSDPIDTTSPQGRLTLQILGAVAEFERALIAERTKAGLERAAAAGRKGGNPGLRQRDGKALRALADARDAARSDRVIEVAGSLLPHVLALRPAKPWREVAHVLALHGAVRPDGRSWTVDSLVRACRRLVRDGLLDAAALGRARTEQTDEALVTLVASIHNALPKPTLVAIASHLRQAHVSTPRGSRAWSVSSVRTVLDHAERKGLLASDQLRPDVSARSGPGPLPRSADRSG